VALGSCALAQALLSRARKATAVCRSRPNEIARDQWMTVIAMRLAGVAVGAVEDAVQAVLTLGAVAQVAGRAVGGVSVAMADLHPIRAWAEERRSHYLVNWRDFPDTVLQQRHSRVATLVRGCFQDAALGSALPASGAHFVREAANRAPGRNLVESRIPRYRNPCFGNSVCHAGAPSQRRPRPRPVLPGAGVFKQNIENVMTGART